MKKVVDPRFNLGELLVLFYLTSASGCFLFMGFVVCVSRCVSTDSELIKSGSYFFLLSCRSSEARRYVQINFTCLTKPWWCSLLGINTLLIKHPPQTHLCNPASFINYSWNIWSTYTSMITAAVYFTRLKGGPPILRSTRNQTHPLWLPDFVRACGSCGCRVSWWWCHTGMVQS